MKKHGFTLIELIAVVIILGLIAVVSFPILINQIKGTEIKIDSETKKILFSAAETYINDNLDNYKYDGTYCIQISGLIDDQYLSEEILNKRKEYETEKNYMIKVSSNSTTSPRLGFEIVSECTQVTFGLEKLSISGAECTLGKDIEAKVIGDVSQVCIQTIPSGYEPDINNCVWKNYNGGENFLTRFYLDSSSFGKQKYNTYIYLKDINGNITRYKKKFNNSCTESTHCNCSEGNIVDACTSYCQTHQGSTTTCSSKHSAGSEVVCVDGIAALKRYYVDDNTGEDCGYEYDYDGYGWSCESTTCEITRYGGYREFCDNGWLVLRHYYIDDATAEDCSFEDEKTDYSCGGVTTTCNSKHGSSSEVVCVDGTAALKRYYVDDNTGEDCGYEYDYDGYGWSCESTTCNSKHSSSSEVVCVDGIAALKRYYVDDNTGEDCGYEYDYDGYGYSCNQPTYSCTPGEPYSTAFIGCSGTKAIIDTYDDCGTFMYSSENTGDSRCPSPGSSYTGG